MIKKETILSVFDKKLTLLQYLKEIKSAIEDSIVESFSCEQIDTTHVKFAINFADDTTYESDIIELPLGPTPNISMEASAETLEPSASASVNVTKSGTDDAPNFSLSFGIPRGEKGENGADGHDGQPSPAYMHVVKLLEGHIYYVYSNDATPFTTATFKTWLSNNGFTSINNALSNIIGSATLSKMSATEMNVFSGVYVSSNNLKLSKWKITIVAGTGFDTLSHVTDSFNSSGVSNDVVIEL